MKRTMHRTNPEKQSSPLRKQEKSFPKLILTSSITTTTPFPIQQSELVVRSKSFEFKYRVSNGLTPGDWGGNSSCPLLIWNDFARNVTWDFGSGLSSPPSYPEVPAAPTKLYTPFNKVARKHLKSCGFSQTMVIPCFCRRRILAGAEDYTLFYHLSQFMKLGVGDFCFHSLDKQRELSLC